MKKGWLSAYKTDMPKEYKAKFKEERLNTNIRRAFWFAVYIVFLQIILNVLNIVYPQVSNVGATVKIPLEFYVLVSFSTLFVGTIYWILLGLARKEKIKNRAAKQFLVESFLYLYYLIQMVFCTFNILSHQGINGQMILVVLIATVPIFPPVQSIITIGATALYTFVLLLATQWNIDSDGLSQWTKIFMSDIRAWFFIVNLMMVFVSVFVYRLYVSNFVLLNRFKDLSEIDALTKLLNRRKFNEVIDREWRRALRQSSALILIIFDIDFFKNFNDTYGHVKGDECLAMIGGALRSAFKRANEYTARYGGEEFAVIMTNYEQEDGIAACNRLMDSVRALKIPHSQSSVADIVTVSAGMFSITPKEGDTLENFIKKADQALYAAKRTGRDRYVVANADDPE